jgi:N-acyl-D-amino-acid deacylase
LVKPDPEFYELIIVGSSIIDGDLTPLFSADLGIKNGKIQAVGDLSGKKAARTIECSGCFLAPGFIDIHSHSDFSLLINPRAESKVRQGVTTEVIGNCGSSAAPLLGHKLKRVRERVEELDVNWKTLKEYRSRLEGAGVAVNVVPLTGQGNIRAAVIGYAERKPDRKEMVKMIALLEQSLEEGSGGISTGLVYPPGVYSDFVELLELIFPVARSGGLYATHMRNESDRVDEAVAEARAWMSTATVIPIPPLPPTSISCCRSGFIREGRRKN